MTFHGSISFRISNLFDILQFCATNTERNNVSCAQLVKDLRFSSTNYLNKEDGMILTQQNSAFSHDYGM